MCFSNLPLKLGIYAGGMAGALGVIMMVYTIWSWAKVGTPNGYATTIVLICFMFAVLFFLVGIIGNYIAILFTELKDRPIYIVGDTKNI
jgi:dolichol-phosphate mannosyltransferase